MLPAGQRNQIVELQSPEDVVETDGTVTRGWHTARSVWASVRPRTMAGGTEFLGPEGASVVPYVVRLLAIDAGNLDSTWRLQAGSRVLEIQAVEDPDGRGAEVVLACTERI